MKDFRTKQSLKEAALWLREFRSYSIVVDGYAEAGEGEGIATRRTEAA